MMLVAVLCTAFAGQAWATDPSVTFNFKQDSDDYGSGVSTGSSDLAINTTWSISPISVKYITKGGSTGLRWWNTTDGLRTYKDNVWQIEASSGYEIESIVYAGSITPVETSATGGTISSKTWTKPKEGGVTLVTFKGNHSSGNKTINSIVVTYSASAVEVTTEAPTISGNTPFLSSTTVTITNALSADGAAIYYTLNGEAPTTTTSATCFAYSAPFTVEATTTVKAIAKHEDDTNASSVVSQTFTKVTPKTVAEALTAIDALPSNGTIANQCVSGIVCTAGASLSSGAITYYISADGNETNRLQVYRGKGLYNAAFEAAGDIAVGDEVVVYGTLKNYNGTTPEFDAGSYLLSQVTKPAPTFSLDKTEATLDAYTHGTVDVTLTTNTDGLISCESSNTDVATVALKSAGVYTITAQSEGSATITIRSAASANYKSASATVAITVEDNRADAGISFAEDEEETTWGESYSTQALTNTNSVAVTWSSTDETVATVNSTTGAITILKAGSTDIKATFAGDATYKATVASYTLTVNKAEAGISYSETSFDVELNDDSFVAPTLNNPNALEGITYTSNNGTVATVNATTGALSLVTTAEGTVKITATFAGNDNYKSGSANYTITVIDPTRKGSKLNPYTVAEVIDGTATGTGIYVKGYIVGEFVGKTTNPRTSGFSGNSNFALADEFSSSPAVANCIPVELPSSPAVLRTNWGLLSNPDKVGYEVLIKANRQDYFSVPGIKGTSEVSAVSVPVTVSAAGYTTITTKYPVSFDGTGVTAYKATAVNPTTIHLEEVEEAPASTPLVIKAAAGTHMIDVVKSASAVTGNLLQSSDGSVTGDGSTIYALGKKDDVVGFYLVGDDVAIPAGKAYITIPTSVKEFLTFDFDDATAIAKIQDSGSKIQDSEIFNLAGQKMSKLQKGVNIVNGKKVLVK